MRQRDHPRVCGEHRSVIALVSSSSGSSPRMRGTHSAVLADELPTGIIPAYAGNTFGGLCARLLRRDHPRVCGEHTSFTVPSFPMTGSSPRMRGTHILSQADTSHIGIIPAYAGNTLKNPSSESRNPIIELHFNQFAKKVKRCFAIRFRPMRCFVFKVQ